MYAEAAADRVNTPPTPCTTCGFCVEHERGPPEGCGVRHGYTVHFHRTRATHHGTVPPLRARSLSQWPAWHPLSLPSLYRRCRWLCVAPCRCRNPNPVEVVGSVKGVRRLQGSPVVSSSGAGTRRNLEEAAAAAGASPRVDGRLFAADEDLVVNVNALHRPFPLMTQTPHFCFAQSFGGVVQAPCVG